MVDIEGSYTVEAAFIVPLILGILFAYILLVLVERDKVVLQGEAQSYLVQMAEDNTDVETKEWKSILQKKLWLMKVRRVSVQKQKKSLKISVSTEIRIRIPVADKFFHGRRNYQQNWKLLTLRPEETVRWKESSDYK